MIMALNPPSIPLFSSTVIKNIEDSRKEWLLLISGELLNSNSITTRNASYFMWWIKQTEINSSEKASPFSYCGSIINE